MPRRVTVGPYAFVNGFGFGFAVQTPLVSPTVGSETKKIRWLTVWGAVPLSGKFLAGGIDLGLRPGRLHLGGGVGFASLDGDTAVGIGPYLGVDLSSRLALLHRTYWGAKGLMPVLSVEWRP